MNLHDHKRATPFGRNRLAALAIGFVATLAGLPGHAALVVPPTPLQSATPIAPNIMFILDDSGSMDWDFMPGAFSSSGVPATTPVAIQLQAYPRNTLSYNPTVDYRPWKNQTGAELTGGTSYTAAYNSAALASGTTNLQDNVQTFYVPKPGSPDLSKTASYFRYQILTNGAVIRSEYIDAGSATPTGTVTAISETNLSANKDAWLRYTIDVPSGASNLVVSMTGGGGSGDADLYLRFGSAPAVNGYDCRPYQSNSNESCTVSSPSVGTYHVGINAYNNIKNINLVATYNVGGAGQGCSTSTSGMGWRNCTATTPTGRDVADELTNYAIWYSYHRTRIKAAKAGVSSAFADLNGESYRVGYATIHNRSTKYIPVGSNNGLFLDVAAQGSTPASNNRTDWFTRLHAAEADSGTPLQVALRRIGEYYSDNTTNNKGASGPYGPAASNQLACRQNYSILTTDGYWNSSTADVGNSDNTDGPLIATPGDVAKKYYTAGPPFKDGVKETLADVAMEYWKTDLMPDMGNIVPSSTANPAFWQHMVTFGISLGLQGSLPQKSVAEVVAAGTTAFTWPDPTDAEDEHRIDDLLHAAVNGHGTFAAATNPTEFASALKAALATITERINSGSNVAVSSASTQGSTKAFVASYLSGKWTGELKAYPVTSGGVGDTEIWRASTTVPKVQRSAVYTVGTNGGGPVTFPTTTQEGVLTTAVANYLKGNRTGEGSTFRERAHLLGDIVNSSPTYVKEGATETVYVGSNDGMLHAFNASDGSELFTYVPSLIDMTSLKKLSVRDPFVHQFFVDGPVVVSSTKQTPGKNQLVGTLGRGGKGVYGLDVTTPSTFGSTGKAWEFAGDNDMGLVLSKPLITKLNSGQMGVVVANGVNSASGRAVLWVLDLATGALITKIDTFKTGSGDNVENGLSAPTGVDADGDGDSDYVYAGDLRGNIWKFDISAATASTWAVAGTKDPLFIAKDSAGTRQPISGGVTVSFNPYTFQPWVFFGTGRYITSGDKEDLSVQSWYGIVDAGAPITGTRASELRQGSIQVQATVNDRTVRSFAPAAPGAMNGKKGWFIDLTSPPNGTADGERMVGTQLVVDGTKLVASSIIPQSSDCNVTGTGFVNVVDLYSGGSVDAPFFDANGDGYYTDADKLTNADGVPVSVGSIDPGVGMPTDPAVLDNLIIVGGSNSGSTAGSGTAKLPYNRLIQDGRISWREILKD